ncbi:hypothetical protein M1M07_25725 [Rhodococcus sp. HM1]|uniref:hypothetical protein n=1 Tax=unclassified Rhodococcus (in: high G+C Gram-positive bacteria) TaxID=192944 RepID=UPI0018CD3AAB|nr:MULTISPECIES: hypothetical protein [unclassified Rhodococcus (in: high G+C Gram-positive bacteria)]MBH0121508.1 hypothetical protein [Rhodococcus sp. CX]MCK8674497.1 hypothetical protein [Rhodococcus sp. HM1]
MEYATFFYSLVALCLLVAASTWCLARPHLLSSLSAAATSVLWILLNGPVEGQVLYSVTAHHGLTEADLLAAAGMGIAVWGYRVGVRDR